MSLTSYISGFLLFLNICCGMQKERSPNNQLTSLIKEHSKVLKKEKNITLRIHGVSCAGKDKIYDGKIHRLDIGYSLDKNLKFDEAKTVFYSVVNDILALINSKQEIRGLFYNQPVTYKDFYFCLSFDYEDKGFLKKDDVSLIAIFENEIMCFIVEEDGANAGLEMKEITPDVSFITGLSPKTHCITEQLPE